jgi:LCP family protein required for cell wall assembly
VGRHSAGRAGRQAPGRRLDPPKPDTRRQAERMVEPAPKMRIHHERRKRMLKRVGIGVLIAIVVIVGGTAAWAYSLFSSAQHTMNENSKETGDLEGVLTEPEPQEPFTVLLLGNDIRKGEQSARADSILVARIDPEIEKVWIVSIPRDTRVEIPGYGTDKINAAHFYGGPSLMVETVEDFLGMPINHYMDINFTGFVKAVDSLGGVWIDVPQEIDDEKAASGSKNRVTHVDAGYQLLNGEQALTFMRSRDYVDADFTRMKNQQAFFKAIADQATNFDNVFKIPGMIKDVAQYMSTDMTVAEMAKVAIALRDMGGNNVETATVAGEWKSPYVWTDEERKEFLVDAMMAGRSFEDTATVDVGAADPASVTVTVRNGAGIEGCATAVADILKAKGYNVVEVGNANQFVYDETLVVYKTGQPTAVQVGKELPTARVVESRGMYAFTTQILVVVGKDFEGWETLGAAPAN